MHRAPPPRGVGWAPLKCLLEGWGAGHRRDASLGSIGVLGGGAVGVLWGGLGC